ncbi:MAG: rhomboid family intramembrane serine protease [Proteobacteria bacterium]|uniref:rhomboid family intramembrane serine protease n=1 Tax=Rudaea sp. TaxID=2136325 RepID=UPI001D5BE5BA|nr:rhomboid family intramembrane serine protease [Pseudomonadota bacterium]MBS0567052.1 rhomboid family intramembrane serine protease [Pseudomonadota bacterium]
MQNIPPVTRALLIANVLIFLLQQMAGDWLIAQFALWPLDGSRLFELGDGSVLRVAFAPWQVVSYAFLHGGITHIAFNMLALWMFGGPVEQALGSRRYTFFYFVCVIGAAFAQLATIHYFKPGDFYPTLGASGGVFGIMLAYAMIYPSARIIMIFFPVPIPAPIAVLGYMAVELVLGVTGTQEGVAHFAHLGGAAAGFVLLRWWRAQALRRRG